MEKEIEFTPHVIEIKKEIYDSFMDLAKEILEHESYQILKTYIQHGKTTTYQHCFSVALLSYKFAYKKRFYDIKSMIRGALLHDFYFYDWHIKDRSTGYNKLHGYTHPKVAKENASKIFNLSNKEKNIIRSHMWPLTIFHFPMTKEAMVVSRIDKEVSVLEHRYIVTFEII